MGLNLGVYGLGFRVEDGMLVFGFKVTAESTNSSSQQQ